MSGFKKVSFHFIFSLPLILSITIGFFSNCTPKDRNQLDAEEIRKYEMQLDSLRKKTDQLSADADPAMYITFYKQSIEILNLLPDTLKKQVNIRFFFLIELEKIGGYEEAIKLAWQIISVQEKSNFKNPVDLNLRVYGSLAGMYKHIGKADSAKIVHLSAVAEAKYHPDELMITAALNNAGMYFYALGNYYSARLYYDLADSLLKAHPSKSASWKTFQGSVKDNIATIYEDQGEFDKAKTIYAENLTLYENTNDLFRWMNAGISLANAKIQLNDHDDVKKLLDHINSMMDTADYRNQPTNTLYLLEVYTKYYTWINDMKNVSVYQEKMINLLNSLNKRKALKHNKTTNMLANYASERFGHKLQIEKSKLKEEEKRSFLLVWILILIVLGSVIIFYYFRQQIRLQEEKAKLNESNRLLTEEKLKTQEHEQRLLNMELKYKKKDITDMALSLKLKQDWAKNMNLHIQNIESAKGHKRSREFKKLKDEIRNQIHVDKKLEILQQNIDMLSKEFFDKLSIQFPGLTKTDKKLCCYIKLDLTSTEIASLQNIDPSSVNVGRYRLKKKLNLDSEQNLDAFLQAF